MAVKKKKEINIFLLIFALALSLLVFYIFSPARMKQEASKIRNSQELAQTQDEIDKTSFEEIDTNLKELSKEAQGM